MSVMNSAPLAKSYGAATMAGKDEKHGRINPALEADDDLPVAEAQRLNQLPNQSEIGAAGRSGGGGQGVAVPSTDHTAF